ncbi:metallophosphoesterase [Candidatus Desantisbacteria bacterium]|nr:metallophosphoesterase [Candidatus Desantisbacteria bacterium]
MENIKLPLILSPSLGFPEIIRLDEEEKEFTVIVASKDTNFGKWSLLLSFSNRIDYTKEIPLKVKSIMELSTDSSYLPSSMEGTRENISNELFQKILGGDVKIFKIAISIIKSDFKDLLRNKNRYLFDLCMEGTFYQKKIHALFLTVTDKKDTDFIHLSDLHLARRNDLIKDEIEAIAGPIINFNNFNENMRKFIVKANSLADKDELDFILIGGDIIDFVNQGISDKGNEPNNNWYVFMEILSGTGSEPQKGNYGIKIPIFTTTGNHDWRLHPYSIEFLYDEFRLNQEEAEKFDFNYYDNQEALEEKNDSIYEKIIEKGSIISKENLLHSVLKSILKYSETWQAKVLIPFLALIIKNISLPENFNSIITISILIIAHLIHRSINYFITKFIRKAITAAIIPIEADVQALYQYFIHINPYFNYAFSYGSNYFILMDTGPDCFVGQKVWNGGNKKRERLSLNDNIMGGSPDSMAFYPLNEFYSYNQINWLEKILISIKNKIENDKRRIFICLHSPPVNLKEIPDISKGEILLQKGVIDIRYGTINHFLSQFFHLCIGKKENDNKYTGEKIDVVISGHTHYSVEFRIDENLKVYCGNYSNTPANLDKLRPIVLQTPPCGPIKNIDRKKYHNPPYFRMIHIRNNGEVEINLKSAQTLY